MTRPKLVELLDVVGAADRGLLPMTVVAWDAVLREVERARLDTQTEYEREGWAYRLE